MPRTGLVLEGGGMRALFSAGVMDVMLENGITFDGVIGVSAGASFGCNYKSRQAGRVLRYNLNYVDHPDYMGVRPLLKTGNIIGAEFAYHTLPTQLDLFDDATYEANPTAFYVVCLDVETGKPIYKRLDKCDREGREWIRASGSMPVVSVPVQVGGYKLLDGAMGDNIPLEYFQSIGYERNVVILTQPRGFQKTPSKAFPLIKMLLKRKYPKVVEAMQRRHVLYNEQLRYLEEQEQMGQTLLIYPPEKLNISRIETNKQKLQDTYDKGREMGLKLLPTIRDFLGSPRII